MSSIKSKFGINLFGTVVGMAVTVVTVPIYVSRLGDARYGILSLVWILLGYLGFLDLGLSRATANALARLGEAPVAERSAVFMTSLWTNAALGACGGVLFYFAGGYLLLGTRDLAPGLAAEIRGSLLYVAPMLCLSLIAGSAIGALEARERFFLANVLQVGTSTAAQTVPLLVAIYSSPSLTTVIPSILAVRVVATVVILTIAMTTERLYHMSTFSYARVKKLVGYGAWVTVSNVVSPLMSSVDQFALARLLGAPAVARYSVAMSVATKLQTVNTALTRTMFPRFSRLEPREALELAGRGIVVLAYASGMLYAGALVVARPAFSWWLGDEFASKAIESARVLLVCGWINGLAFIPFSLLQGQGRPDVAAKLHCAEIVPYVGLLYVLVHYFGLTGAALAWGIRVSADAAALTYFARLPLGKLLKAIPALIGMLVGFGLGQTVAGLSLFTTMLIGTSLAVGIGGAGLLVVPDLRSLLPVFRKSLPDVSQ